VPVWPTTCSHCAFAGHPIWPSSKQILQRALVLLFFMRTGELRLSRSLIFFIFPTSSAYENLCSLIGAYGTVYSNVPWILFQPNIFIQYPNFTRLVNCWFLNNQVGATPGPIWSPRGGRKHSWGGGRGVKGSLYNYEGGASLYYYVPHTAILCSIKHSYSHMAFSPTEEARKVNWYLRYHLYGI
jgi:hypothetical protein